jgi:beta-glucosidase
MSVMPSYNEIDGVPSHASAFLLQRVLRQEWGFRGHVASDYYGITDLQRVHHVAADKAEAARIALESGVDTELPDPDCYLTIPQLLKEGVLSETLLNAAVARNLRAKFLLGLFENPYVDPERAVSVTNSWRIRPWRPRRRVVRLFCLRTKTDCSRWTVRSSRPSRSSAPMLRAFIWVDTATIRAVVVSVLQGIKDKVGAQLKVSYAEGCKITQEGGNWWADSSKLGDPAVDAGLIAEAVEVAKAADITVLVIGGNEDTNKEAWAENHLGDRDSLDLVGRQNDLVKAVLATGKPVVAMLINSGPLSVNYVAANVPAILEGFYLGQETGVAVADVLFGDSNPAGKLAISFPRSVGQLPIFYNHKPTAKRGYLFADREPLFPFGFGLSYSTFEYSNLKVTPERIGPESSAQVSVTVVNTSKVAGDEIVQLYIHDVVSSVTRPVKELKDFRRVSLSPGEKKTVTFVITPDKLSFLNLHMERVVEPGWLRLWWERAL